MSRKCDNWLESFLEWTAPRSEAPEELLVWSGLFTLSSVVKRKICFPKSLLGSYAIYPSLYVLFVGPPAVVRKSTTAGYTETLLHAFNEGMPVTEQRRINIAPAAGSHSRLIELMSKTVDGSMTIISSEFSNLVMTTPEEMYELLTDLFDSKKEYIYSTRMHADEIIDKPCLNLLGCTTPSWLSENSGHMIGGGFASRVIFIFSEKARQRKMYYDDVIDWQMVMRNQENLVSDLRLISQLKGEFQHETPALKHRMEEWYQEYAEGLDSGNVEGFHARKHVHVHKIAGLLSLSQRNDLVITDVHFESALALMDQVEESLSRGLSVVGRNPYSADLYRIRDFVESRGPVPKRVILSAFWQDLQPDEVAKILEALIFTDEISVVGTATDGSALYGINA